MSTSPMGPTAATESLDIESLMRGWEALQVNRTRPYAVQQDDGTYRWIFRPLDRKALRAHFSGTTTLALSSLDEQGQCRWVCLDDDTPDGMAQLVHVRAAL